MIRHNCAQGSEEWHGLRLGKPTASNFDRILTPGGKLSTQSHTFALVLASERILGYPSDKVTTAAMKAGRENEPAAAALYELQHPGAEVEEVGICFTGDGLVGASPDRLVGSDGLLEVKCPEPHTHLGYMLNYEGAAREYWHQIQGQLWVCERDWLDMLSYCPGFPPCLRRVARDEEYIAKLKSALDAFNESMLKIMEALTSMGCREMLIEERVRAQAAPDDDGLGVSMADVEAILAAKGL